MTGFNLRNIWMSRPSQIHATPVFVNSELFEESGPVM
jgi:hypothetical protein